MLKESPFLFFNQDISFVLGEKTKIEHWITRAITEEKKLLGELTYIFCSDDYLYQMNMEHLQHDSYTDIITFNYCENNTISGDIFISIDRIKDNAEKFKTRFLNELHRVMIHGVLHLIGYNDKSKEDQRLMRSKEDFYLTLLSN